jgi:hypothetical protein
MPATPKALIQSVPNVTGVISVTVTEAFNSAMAQTVIECYDTSLSLGDSIGFNMGFSGDSGKIFQGYVRQIETGLVDAKNRIVCEDELAKASDYFMASSDPAAPFTRDNIDTGVLIGDILNEAQITSFSDDTALSVTWGTQGTITFNLTTAWQAAKTIIDALAWHLYADRTGTVHLTEDKPYDASPSIDFTWNLTTDNIMNIVYAKTTERLRNKIVVYGRDGVSASASAASAFLPAGFFKTAVLASQLFDTDSLAQTVADTNLELLNRLTETLTMTVEGNYQIEPRKWATITVVDADISMNVTGDWFIYQVEHRMDQAGYLCNVTLTR